MRKIIPAFACIALVCAAPALAGGPGGHGAGARAGAGVGVGAVGVGAGVNTSINAGGRGPSATAMENSNGRFVTDREFGRDRAEERMSEQGRRRAAMLQARIPGTRGGAQGFVDAVGAARVEGIRARPGHHQPGVASLRPMIPATIRTMLAMRNPWAGSLNSTMPRMAVPTAPMPTHTA